ncbi:MAG: hypothetical protein ACD_16C00194G0001 [uncultured bacterium]|nr:MAG: hypothetical protein ACD_16C00194G0001 [uncultured bacterium]OFW69038.1 MAG: methyltransferase [Alphaproteobacteria bacterium GWC2_42_16]OFW82215.1 MAG: methyltransferase [Alphaproteobacteria bacterium RIFCSPHIGHO2_12_FULL_42_100]OFW86457.1 MAG: methyltransferase [Alphaproteobacteria bacterium RBG_16_42_14]OFW91381.1 MAG: methyltransferase [Alphaproteobacteria bacterium RIFCSPHIGHO2_02_FULL_42_30]OFW93725.1 MAG: methyltransferase [Alphaproteobacteria bacterium RIFCSPHIGHO2_12_42_13]OF
MALVNLLRHYPKAQRKMGKPRSKNPLNIEVARKFGREYFDGTREQGYGGYKYDGRWVPIAKDILDYFCLKPGMNVLDVGCAKGFLMKDLMDACPGLKVFGLDISYYAISNCMKDVKGRCIVENAKCLPFSDKSFDAIISINTLHNLEREDLKIALKEIERVSKGKSFVQLDAYQNDEELEVFKDWVLTAKTYLKPHEWEQLFQECGYTGDYFWTILSPDPKWTDFSSDKKTAPVWNTTA